MCHGSAWPWPARLSKGTAQKQVPSPLQAAKMQTEYQCGMSTQNSHQVGSQKWCCWAWESYQHWQMSPTKQMDKPWVPPYNVSAPTNPEVLPSPHKKTVCFTHRSLQTLISWIMHITTTGHLKWIRAKHLLMTRRKDLGKQNVTAEMLEMRGTRVYHSLHKNPCKIQGQRSWVDLSCITVPPPDVHPGSTMANVWALPCGVKEQLCLQWHLQWDLLPALLILEELLAEFASFSVAKGTKSKLARSEKKLPELPWSSTAMPSMER